MIPSRRWFPVALAERAAWFMNFAAQFAKVAADLGFTAAVVRSVQNDNEVMQFLADTSVQLAAFEKAVRQYRILITESAKGADTPAFPDNTDFQLPQTVNAGIFERLDALRTQIMAADNYTDEIGALLGILPSQSEKLSPESLKPAVTVSNVTTDYRFTVHATRMGMPAFKVQIRRAGSETWTDAAFSTNADVVVKAAPLADGQSERLQARVILLKNNEPVGEPSDAIYVTVNP